MITNRPLLMLFVLCALPMSAFAHFPMWIPGQPYAQIGEQVSVTFFHGHPFEHIFADAVKPTQISVVLPSGQSTIVSEDDFIQKMVDSDGETHDAWSFGFDAQQQGDHIIALDGGLEFGRNNRAYQDLCKAIINVEREDGWRNSSGQPVEFMPYTRPYGLLPGSAVTLQLVHDGKPVANTMVEIERYNDAPPAEADIPHERFITARVVTDANGMIAHTLHEAGWWLFAAYVPEIGEVENEGETYSLNASVGFAVYIDAEVE